MNPFDLSGRRYLVTGASSGIGRAVSKGLSGQGARILAVARNEERLRETVAGLSGDGHGYQCVDLLQEGDMTARMKTWATEGGAFHGAVHAAGIQLISPIRMFDEKDFEGMWRINVEAALLLARAFRRKEVRADTGSIVFISSIAGLTGQPVQSGYSSTKGALIAAARALAMELAPERIRVNCVAPGLVRTPMADRLRNALGDGPMSAVESAHPLGLGEPEDVANAVAFLLSDAARWITGTTLAVDGGYTAQ